MWKPTKKQHLTNKKYVDESSGSGGSGLVIEAIMDTEGNITFSPLEPGLTIDDFFGAIVQVTYEDIISSNAPSFGYSKVTEANIDPNTNIIYFYFVLTGSKYYRSYNQVTGELS